MAIKAITGTVPVSSYINFSSRKSKDVVPFGEGNVTHNRKTSKLKQVPVIVMIAMSPLSTKASKFKPIELNAPKIEMVEQNPPQEILKRRITKVFGNQKIEYSFISKDGDIHNFEKVYMRYANPVGDKVKYLNGQVIALCAETKPNGDYLIAIRKVEDGTLKKNFELCYIPEDFGYILDLSHDTPANNNAIMRLPKSEFNEYFGRHSVDNAPNIADFPMPYYANTGK